MTKDFFRSSDKEKNEVFIASKAGWDEQLKGLIELERRCLVLREEVEHLSERQEVLTGLMVSKKDMRKAAPEKYQEKIFEEFKELEEQRAKEALALVQKKHKLIKWEGEKGKGKHHAKVGGVKSNWSMVWTPRLFSFCFLPIVLGPLPHRRSNVCFLQDGARGGCGDVRIVLVCSGKGEGKRLVEH